MNNRETKGFTLVELIVVITILAILGTIAFISLQNYSENARDSVRISDMKNIEKGLELELTKRGKITMPEDEINISASGTLIAYQGYAGDSVLNNIGVHGGGKDPIDERYYTYIVNNTLTSYAILGYFEGENGLSLLQDTFAVNYEERFPKVLGTQLGVLLQSGSLKPAQEDLLDIDIVNTNNHYIAYLTNEDIVEGTGSTLEVGLSHRINEIASCNTILKNGKSIGNGIYTIDPEDNGIGFDVYCDMTSNGGGWTLLVSAPGESSKFGDRSINGIWKVPVYDTNVPDGLISQEFMSQAYGDLVSNEILLCYKDTTNCYNFKHNMNMPMFDFFDKDISYVDYSFNLVGYGDQGNIENMYNYFSTLGVTTGFYGNCGFLGINNTVNNLNSTRLIIGYGGDSDSPCISLHNSTSSSLDNQLLGLAGNLRFIGVGSTHVDLPYLPGYQSYNLFDSVFARNGTPGPAVYLSKAWFVLGK